MGLLPALPCALLACGPSDASSEEVRDADVHAALRWLDSQVPQWLERTGVPGAAVAVVHRGVTLHAAGYGLRRINEAAAVNADTVFQLASVSKSIAASVMAVQMRVQPEISWDTPIAHLMPSFKLAYPDAATNARLSLGDLFAHRSGLPEHAGDRLEDLGYPRTEILQRLCHVALKPYGGYDYTNFGLTAAAQAVADAAGMDWAELSQQAIYRPLGMHRTSSRHADFVAHANRAWGHVQADASYGNYGAAPARYGVADPQRQPDAQSPAGGVSASANDIAQWMKLVLAGGLWQGRQLASAAALRLAMAARPGGKYGYGFNVGPDPHGHVSVSHSGAFILGAATAYLLWPEAELGIAILTNASPRGLPEAIGLGFGERAWGDVPADAHSLSQDDWLARMQPKFHDLYQAEGRLVGLQPPAAAAAAQPPAAYTGRYANAYWGQVLVLADEGSGALELSMGPAAVRYRLRHWDGDLFVFTPQGESVAPASVCTVQFAPGQMLIELFNEDLAHGRFDRTPV